MTDVLCLPKWNLLANVIVVLQPMGLDFLCAIVLSCRIACRLRSDQHNRIQGQLYMG